MTTIQKTSGTRPAATAHKSAPKAAATHTASTAKAGWNTAAKTSAPQLLGHRLDVTPDQLKAIPFSKSSGLSFNSQSGTEKDGAFSLKWSNQNLVRNGKTLLGGKPDLSELQQTIRAEAKHPSPYEGKQWSFDESLKPMGSFGKFIGVARTESQYSGGAHGNSSTQLRTLDQSGKQVKLSQLLSPKEMAGMVKQIRSQLDETKIDGYAASAKDVHDAIDQSFIVVRDPKTNQPRLRVAVEPWEGAKGGLVATFDFAAPKSLLAAAGE